MSSAPRARGGSRGTPWSRTALLTLVGLLVLALAATTVLTLRRHSDDPGPGIGVFRHTSMANVEKFESWSGQRLTHVVDFSSREDWRDIAQPDYMLREWRGSGLRQVYAVAMVPEQVPASMRAGADGTYDDYYRRLGENLVRADQADAVLRIGWEFNLNSSPYNTDPQTFVTYYRRIVTAMRSVPGQQFAFDWNVNNGPSGDDARPFYPGDDVVDHVAVDVYDVAPAAYPYPPGCDATCRQARQEQAWAQVYAGERGLRYWSAFARSRNKPMSIPEWGVWDRADGTGGGDNPLFIRRMHDFIYDPANRVAYASYFESNNNPVGRHRLMVGFPEAARIYRKLFGD